MSTDRCKHGLRISDGCYACDIRKLAPPETDPTGADPHTPGAKLDAGKPLAGLVLGDFARALQQVVAVGTFGANKYTPHGWLSVPDGQRRYTNAMLRHWLAEMTGETRDPQSELLHAAHLAWNALARLELMMRNQPDAGR